MAKRRVVPAAIAVHARAISDAARATTAGSTRARSPRTTARAAAPTLHAESPSLPRRVKKKPSAKHWPSALLRRNVALFSQMAMATGSAPQRHVSMDAARREAARRMDAAPTANERKAIAAVRGAAADMHRCSRRRRFAWPAQNSSAGRHCVCIAHRTARRH